jgi:hypothetical protein
MNNYYDLERRMLEIKAEAEKSAAAAWKNAPAAARKQRVIDRITRIALGLFLKRKNACL